MNINLIEMNCTCGGKVLINIDELKSSTKLEGATVFNYLFGLNNDSPWKSENININLFKEYNISENNWSAFINFIRNGRVRHCLTLADIFIKELDIISSTGIFLKFGPFPSFEKYLNDCINTKKKQTTQHIIHQTNNPMTPKEDTEDLFIWVASYNTPSPRNNQEWSVTVKVGNLNADKMYYRLKKNV